MQDPNNITTHFFSQSGKVSLYQGGAVVSNTMVASDSLILLTSQADGGTPGFLRITSIVPGTSFTIMSSSNTDSSTVAWFMIEGL